MAIRRILRLGKHGLQLALLVAVGFALLPGFAVSQEPPADADRGVAGTVRPEFGLRVGAGQSDNIGRSADGARTEIKAFGLDFSAGAASRRMDGSIAADLEYRQYDAGLLANDDEMFGSLDGALSLQVVPDRFSWSFAHNTGQARSDPLAPAGLDNRQRITVFSVGPDVTLPAGPRNELQIGARVSDRRFDDTELFDSRMTTGRLAFVRALDTAARIGMIYDRRKSEFDRDALPYEFDIVALTYGREFSSGGVRVSLGKGEIGLDQSTESTSVARAEWTRGVGARSRVRLWAGRELTDAGEIFRLGGTQGFAFDGLSSFDSVAGINDGRLRGVVLSGDPLQRSSTGVALDLVARRTTFGVSVTVSEDEFEVSELFNNDLTVLGLSAARELGRRWRASISVFESRQEFSALGERNDDSFYTLNVDRRFARKARLSLVFNSNRRSAGFDSFSENLYIVYLGYDF